MDDKLLKPKEAAEFIGFSEATLRHSRSTGKLSGCPTPKYKRLGKSIRYAESDLRQWIADNLREAE